MSARRIASRVGTGAVAVIAAIASYSHMRHLALTSGQEDLIAILLPLSVDGLVIVGAVAIGDGRRHTWSAWLAFWVGVVASIAANVADARPDVTARLISAWPALALILVVEVISRSGPGRRADASVVCLDASAVRPDTSVVCPDASDCGTEFAGISDHAGILPGDTPAVRRNGKSAGELILSLREQDPKISVDALAEAAGVSKRHVWRVLQAG